MSRKTTSTSPVTARPPSPWSRFLTTETIIVGGTALITLGIILVVVISGLANQPVEIADLETIPGLPRNHRENVSYPDEGVPPAGGNHNAVWQNCGVYAIPVRNENAVHSLEHGAVWITYQPDLPADQVARLASLVSRSTHRLISPYPDQDSPIVLTAWGHRLRLTSADDPRIEQFLRNYEQGPQTPEPGARCDGGIGQPLS